MPAGPGEACGCSNVEILQTPHSKYHSTTTNHTYFGSVEMLKGGTIKTLPGASVVQMQDRWKKLFYKKFVLVLTILWKNESMEDTGYSFMIHCFSFTTIVNAVPAARSSSIVPCNCSTRESTSRNPSDLAFCQSKSAGIPTPLSLNRMVSA